MKKLWFVAVILTLIGLLFSFVTSAKAEVAASGGDTCTKPDARPADGLTPEEVLVANGHPWYPCGLQQLVGVGFIKSGAAITASTKFGHGNEVFDTSFDVPEGYRIFAYMADVSYMNWPYDDVGGLTYRYVGEFTTSMVFIPSSTKAAIHLVCAKSKPAGGPNLDVNPLVLDVGAMDPAYNYVSYAVCQG